MKVLINGCVGGFGVSEAVLKKLLDNNSPLLIKQQIQDDDLDDFMLNSASYCIFVDVDNKCCYDFDRSNDKHRSDTLLIKIVEELGEAANGVHSRLKIVDIPDDVDWHIVENNDGSEYVAENHRTWG